MPQLDHSGQWTAQADHPSQAAEVRAAWQEMIEGLKGSTGAEQEVRRYELADRVRQKLNAIDIGAKREADQRRLHEEEAAAQVLEEDCAICLSPLGGGRDGKPWWGKFGLCLPAEASTVGAWITVCANGHKFHKECAALVELDEVADLRTCALCREPYVADASDMLDNTPVLDLYPATEDFSCALTHAAQYGELDWVGVLLEANAEINFVNRRDFNRKKARLSNGGCISLPGRFLGSKPALSMAIWGGHTAVFKMLLAHNANPNILDVDEFTPLMQHPWLGSDLYPGVSDKLAIVEALLENNADPNLQNKYGQTALFSWVARGETACVRALLANNADPNLQYGWTPTGPHDRTVLAAAASCTCSQTDIVELLLNAGANPAVRVNGRTALQLATMRGHADVVKLLRRAHAQRLFPALSPQQIARLVDDEEKEPVTLSGLYCQHDPRVYPHRRGDVLDDLAEYHMSSLGFHAWFSDAHFVYIPHRL